MRNISGIIGKFPGNKRIATRAKSENSMAATASDCLSDVELDSTGEPSSASHSTNSRPSLLDSLKCPEPSLLARKRKVKTNPPVGAKRSQGRSSLSHTYNPKSVSPAQRVKEFPDEAV